MVGYWNYCGCLLPIDRFYDSTLSAELAATMEGILKERLGRRY